MNEKNFEQQHFSKNFNNKILKLIFLENYKIQF